MKNRRRTMHWSILFASALLVGTVLCMGRGRTAEEENGISIEFEEHTDLIEMIEALVEYTDKEVRVDPSVSGELSAKIVNVQAEIALRLILRIQGLGLSTSRESYRVYSRRSRRLEDVNCQVLVRRIAYMDLDDAMEVVRREISEEHGKILKHRPSRTLAVMDLPQVVARIETLIDELDQPEPEGETGLEERKEDAAGNSPKEGEPLHDLGYIKGPAPPALKEKPASTDSEEEMVPLIIDLPKPVFIGTPKNAPADARLKPPSDRKAYESYVRARPPVAYSQLAQEMGPLLGRPRCRTEDEVLIIQKSESPPTPQGERYPTQGELRAKRSGEEIPLPLKHTDVSVQISAFIASVGVEQQYNNPYDTKIEAVYVFPLPQDAAVTDFIMIIGERRIRGMIREKEEAKRLYEAAKAQGHRAALLTQERPNIFEQKVANIEPGEDIDVNITYFNTLPYRDGKFEFVFPMVVGPRFNPPGSTEGVGAVARGNRGASGQSTEVEYLKPGERSGQDIDVTVSIDAGMDIEDIHSPSHAVHVKRQGSSATVSLKRHDRIPNRDLVLRYRLAGDELKTALLVNESEQGNTFALLLQPPANMVDVPRMPREMIFVLDCSGSMNGFPIEKSKEAMNRCLRSMDKDDTFQILRFSDSASSWGPVPVPATEANVREALAFIEGLHGSGGTMMIEGVKAALSFPHDERRLRVVSFMTDGYIGNEAQILRAVEERLGDSRIFSFGIGNSVNRYLIERMASFGRGTAAFVGLNEGAARAVDRFYERLAHPALCDVELDWGGSDVSDVFPVGVPDVFVGRPVLVTGRYEGRLRGPLTIRGRVGGRYKGYEVAVNAARKRGEHPGIASVWARSKIRALHEAEIKAGGDAELKHEIILTSMEHRVLSQYTAFLAVDSLEKTKGAFGVSVNVPVPVPDGVRYETTVRETSGSAD